MSPQEHFLNRVQVELDAGRDPLDCPSILAWLEEHPEDLEDFVNLRVVGLQLAAATTAAAAAAATTAAAAATAAAATATAATAAAAAVPSKTRTWWKPLTALASVAAAWLIFLSLYTQKPEPESTPPMATLAILLTHEVSTQRNFTVSPLAPANSDSGAVVLSMSSSQRRSNY